jgi:site-specific DNA-methyltransferase (adenine-specific)
MIELNRIYCGDSIEVLKTFPNESIDSCITSPPYWALRNYGIEPQIWDEDKDCNHQWTGKRIIPKQTQWNTGGVFDPEKRKVVQEETIIEREFCSVCGAWRGSLGLEPTIALYIKHLCDVFDEVKRVLKKRGTVWVNIGDTFYSNYGGANEGKVNPEQVRQLKSAGKNKTSAKELPQSCLSMIGARFAIEMCNRGWILRNQIIWKKPNCMPSSAKNRFTVDYECVYFFVKNKEYNFETQYEPVKEISLQRAKYGWHGTKLPHGDSYAGFKGTEAMGERYCNPLGRNMRAVWTIPTKGFSGAHFACVSEDTEILTIDGWKKYNEINYKQHKLVATYNLEKQIIEYQPIQYLKTYNYNNFLIKAGTKDLDILMTPNHRNVVLKRKSKKEKIILAEELSLSDKIRVKAPVEYPEKNGLGKNLAELLGWIISEGNFNKSCSAINIYQNKNNKSEKIKNLLKLLQIPFSEKIRIRNINNKSTKQVEFYLKTGVWTDFIRTIIPNKILTKELISLPQEEIKALFNGLILGDGNTRKDGRITFIQKNKECVDWFEILALRLGYHTITIKRKIGNCYSIFLTKKDYIGLRKTNGKGIAIKKEYYNGVVWCPKTPNGTWVAKRNGRVFITGNTFPEKLIEPMIKAGCPEFVCPKCGKAKKAIYETEYIVRAIRSTEEKQFDVGDSMAKPNLPFMGDAVRTKIGETDCGCGVEFIKGVVCDPYMGSGTSAIVAKNLGRDYIGIDLNPEYIKMAEERINSIPDKLL